MKASKLCAAMTSGSKAIHLDKITYWIFQREQKVVLSRLSNLMQWTSHSEEPRAGTEKTMDFSWDLKLPFQRIQV